MTITMGELISEIFQVYDRELHDEHLAAVATQVRLCELLRDRPHGRRRPRRR